MLSIVGARVTVDAVYGFLEECLVAMKEETKEKAR